MIINNSLEWHKVNECPEKNRAVLIESLQGFFYYDFIKGTFDGWGDDIVRWAYIPTALFDGEVKYWRDKYLTLIGKYHNERQCDSFVGRNSRRDNSDGDEHLTADDLRELFDPHDAEPIGEVSVDDLRDFFLKVLREKKKRERTKAADEDDGK